MQTTNLPVCIKHKIDQAFRRFIWSRAHPQQKMSLVSWDRVCQLKNCGGLGFNNLELMNKALLMKLGWNLVASPNSLWSQVLCTKYSINPGNLPYTLITHWIWISLVEIHRKSLARDTAGDSLELGKWPIGAVLVGLLGY